jgi:site-specific DNA-methyltransferase (adenine-specific)
LIIKPISPRIAFGKGEASELSRLSTEALLLLDFESMKANPDVLSCLANLSSDEIFTPPAVANEILDLLPNEVWKNADYKFCDPCSKTGVFPREIVKRLMVGLESVIADPLERLRHILNKQVYAYPLTLLTHELTKRTLYFSRNLLSDKSPLGEILQGSSNVLFEHLGHSWKGDNCEHCGAKKSIYGKDERVEDNAYPFIHLPPKSIEVPFDVIVGGPPFQLFDGGGTGASARPLYHLFVQRAIQLKPRYVALVTPARWYSGGKGLDEFRKTMMRDKRLKKIVDFPDTRNRFATDIAGGICYFLWDREHSGPCQFYEFEPVTETFREEGGHLDEFEYIVRSSIGRAIIKKIRMLEEPSFSSIVSPRKPFGFGSNFTGDREGELKLRHGKGWGNVSREKVTQGHDSVDSWKVLLSKASFDHGGQPDASGQRKVFSRIEVLKPGEVCTESYLIIGNYEAAHQAERTAAFLKTTFCRYLVTLIANTHNISRSSFDFVPLPGNDEEISDSHFFSKYGLTDLEIKEIKNAIKAIEE